MCVRHMTKCFCDGERRENGGVPERQVREGVETPERRSTLAAVVSRESAPHFYDSRPFLIGRSYFSPRRMGWD